MSVSVSVIIPVMRILNNTIFYMKIKPWHIPGVYAMQSKFLVFELSSTVRTANNLTAHFYWLADVHTHAYTHTHKPWDGTSMKQVLKRFSRTKHLLLLLSIKILFINNVNKKREKKREESFSAQKKMAKIEYLFAISHFILLAKTYLSNP